MQELDNLYKSIRAFEQATSNHRYLSVHKDNKFNKQLSVVLRDFEYLKIIAERIETADPNNATQLGLDLKSFYVFGRVFSESLIYIVSLFIKSSSKIDWTKIGPFVKSIEANLNSEVTEFKSFWGHNEKVIRSLYETFKYRNYVLHEKNSNTKWTFAQLGKSNLDQVYIANIPWEEDAGMKKEQKTLDARSLMWILGYQSSLIFDYLVAISKFDING